MSKWFSVVFVFLFCFRQMWNKGPSSEIDFEIRPLSVTWRNAIVQVIDLFHATISFFTPYFLGFRKKPVALNGLNEKKSYESKNNAVIYFNTFQALTKSNF